MHGGVPGFGGLKVTWHEDAARQFGLRTIRLLRARPEIVTEPGYLGWGGNSGFHALNLAVQFGARRIVLVGYDMRIDLGRHWHGDHPSGLNNPNAQAVDRWARILDAQAPVLEALGVEVLNASPVSALAAYPKVSLGEALS